nr:hypothetical protein [uncultured Desulfuromonas sp.]
MKLLRSLVVLMVLISVTACGKVGPVKPLQKALPSAVNHATLDQKGNALLLAWDIPTSNQDGSPLENLKGFDIYRSDYNLAKGCPECRPPKNLLRQIDLAYYQSTNRNSTRVYLWDSAVEEEVGYRYRIVPMTDDGHAGADLLIHRPCYSAPYPPMDISGEALDKLVRLNWTPAQEGRQGVEVVGYNVYRRSGGNYFAAEPLNDNPVKETAYEDFQVSNDTLYTYAVRSVIRLDDQLVESPLSHPVNLQPRRP